MEEKSKPKSKGGLEFVPLPPGKTEEFFEVPRGRRHPKQLDVFVQGEEVRPDGKRKGRG